MAHSVTVNAPTTAISPSAAAARVNVPPADLLMSFFGRTLKQPAVNHPVLLGFHEPLRAAQAEVAKNIGGAEKSPDYDLARKRCGVCDGTFDALNRFVLALLDAYLNHPDEALRQAAGYLRDLLFPEGLGAVIQAAWEIEAASGATFEKRLAQPRAVEAQALLTVEVPRFGEHLLAIPKAASELGKALEVLDGFMVDKAGRPLNPGLFEARWKAHQLFATFAQVVETVAYPSDSEEDIKARTALLGPYRRFTAAPRARGADSAPADAPVVGATD